MVKTANHDEEKPTSPPSDAQIVKEFIADTETLADLMKTTADDKAYLVLQGHMEARQILAEQLAQGKAARLAYVKDVGERFTEAMTSAGKSVADFVNKLQAKAEERADQDRK